jgi:hypothetical protein
MTLESELIGSRMGRVVLVAGVDSAVLRKIKKALSLGGHRATGEAEAKRAMRFVVPITPSRVKYVQVILNRVAAKLMAQHK